MSIAGVADGELAAVVTFLEMLAPPQPAPSLHSPLALVALARPPLDRYRTLFRRIGARWLWFSRLAMTDHELGAIVHHPAVELYAVLDPAGEDCGMIELDFRVAHQCELAFIGLVPEFAGKGHGRWLIAEALRLAWRGSVTRVHVHTCTLDHPAALGAYLRAGFVATGRGVERFADPRLLGILDRGCAPQVPLLGTLASASAPASAT